jgi:hypothetical protein
LGGRPGRPGSRSRFGGSGFVAFIVLAALAASGCQLLAGAGVPVGMPGASALPIGSTSGESSGGVGGAVGEPEPDASFPGAGPGLPRAVATYHAGRATIQLTDGTQVVLDRLNRGPHLYAGFGSLVRWSNDGGWYLTITGAGAEADMGPPYLVLDRVTGTEHWTADEPRACAVQITTATPAGLRGTAVCRGARWVDALDTSIGGDHPLVAGAAPFGATVTFEAGP